MDFWGKLAQWKAGTVIVLDVDRRRERCCLYAPLGRQLVAELMRVLYSSLGLAEPEGTEELEAPTWANALQFRAMLPTEEVEGLPLDPNVEHASKTFM